MENLAKIGIDFWGILLYIINYGSLLAVLSYFLYPKLRKVISDRRKMIAKNIEDAETLSRELESYMEKSKKEKEKMIHEVKQQREENKAEIQATRKEVGLNKENKIELVIVSEFDDKLKLQKNLIAERVNAKSLSFEKSSKKFNYSSEGKIKNRRFEIFFNRV